MNSADIRGIKNRRNAAKSTGPRSPEGKRRSSKNALRHGLSANRAESLGEGLIGAYFKAGRSAFPSDHSGEELCRTWAEHRAHLERIAQLRYNMIEHLLDQNQARSIEECRFDESKDSNEILQEIEKAIRLERYDKRSRSSIRKKMVHNRKNN